MFVVYLFTAMRGDLEDLKFDVAATFPGGTDVSVVTETVDNEHTI